MARRSFGKPYQCQQDWPESCFVQCGDNGIVIRGASMAECFDADDPLKKIAENISRVTAFFEAFPRSPDTFIRGEGESVEGAEKIAWDQYLKFSACSKHEWEKRGYKNGAGFCKHCGMFSSGVFDPEYRCIVCDIATYYGCDKTGDVWYCKDHIDAMPRDMWPRHRIAMERLNRSEPT